MFILNYLENSTIDLDGFNEYSEEFEIQSFNENGKRQPFYVDLVTNENINVTIFDVNFVRVTIDVSMIVNEETIVLRNYIGETITITVKPNLYFLSEKEYKFKITRAEFSEDGQNLKLKILSKVNGEELGWKCIYNGRPISYFITPMVSDKSEYVNIKLLSRVFQDCISVLRFEQNESEEVIEYRILNTPEGMKKAD